MKSEFLKNCLNNPQKGRKKKTNEKQNNQKTKNKRADFGSNISIITTIIKYKLYEYTN